MPFFNKNDTANATVELIAAEAGKKHIITRVIISVGDKGEYSLRSGTTTILGPYYLPEDGGFDYEPQKIIKTNDGEALNLFKNTAGNKVTVSGEYTSQ